MEAHTTPHVGPTESNKVFAVDRKWVGGKRGKNILGQWTMVWAHEQRATPLGRRTAGRMNANTSMMMRCDVMWADRSCEW